MSADIAASINKLSDILERLVVVLMQQNARMQAEATNSSSTNKPKEEGDKKVKDPNALGPKGTAALFRTAGNSQSGLWDQGADVASAYATSPQLAAAMASIYATKMLVAQQEGVPYGRFELEFAKYSKPRTEMTEMAENLGASNIVKDKEWWSKTFEMKKAQREAIEENIKTMSTASALAPTAEAGIQTLTDSMSKVYEKTAQILDSVLKAQLQLWSFK